MFIIKDMIYLMVHIFLGYYDIAVRHNNNGTFPSYYVSGVQAIDTKQDLQVVIYLPQRYQDRQILRVLPILMMKVILKLHLLIQRDLELMLG